MNGCWILANGETSCPKAPAARENFVEYDLKHLTQASTESALGPIQDTEALFLYAVVRGMRMTRVLEIGGLTGYSARNFLQAFANPAVSTLYTVDLNPVPKLAANHVVLVKNALELRAADVGGRPMDLVFFDCHDYDIQMRMYNAFVKAGIINETTVLALHDTNLHPQKITPDSYQVPGQDGWVHQSAERRMVNTLVQQGYHAFSLHTPLASHDASMPYRHGVTLMQRFKPLRV